MAMTTPGIAPDNGPPPTRSEVKQPPSRHRAAKLMSRKDLLNFASPHLTVQGPEWHTDPYFLSPGPKSLLTVFGAEHGLGGVTGYDAAETTDEKPERVAAVAHLAWADLAHPAPPARPRLADSTRRTDHRTQAGRTRRRQVEVDARSLGRIGN